MGTPHLEVVDTFSKAGARSELDPGSLMYYFQQEKELIIVVNLSSWKLYSHQNTVITHQEQVQPEAVLW